jgi:hypothetical protein
MQWKALFAVPLLVALAGCGGSSSSQLRANLTFSADVTSIFKNLKSLNAGVTTVGWNQLTGPTTINGSAATVEVLANVNYRNGSGPFYGFITFTLADDSSLTLKMDGEASLNTTTGTTTFVSTLSTLGGTGIYASSSGSGTFTGSRTTALGGAVHMDVLLELH